MFLSGWLGGPPLYFHAHGHPMLRARHLPFAIGVKERNQWVACMDQAIAETGVDPLLRERSALVVVEKKDAKKDAKGRK